jgi:hypothetical protein
MLLSMIVVIINNIDNDNTVDIYDVVTMTMTMMMHAMIMIRRDFGCTL